MSAASAAWGRSCAERRLLRGRSFLSQERVRGQESGTAGSSECCPVIVAFTGKRQWTELFEPALPRVESGPQSASSRPPGWPFPPEATEVWVLPSSSGRAAFTNEERERPYRALAERLAGVPWPLAGKAMGVAACGGLQ